jgi:hypothetical protein
VHWQSSIASVGIGKLNGFDKRAVNITIQIESPRQRYFRDFPLAFSQDKRMEGAAPQALAVDCERGNGWSRLLTWRRSIARR